MAHGGGVKSSPGPADSLDMRKLLVVILTAALLGGCSNPEEAQPPTSAEPSVSADDAAEAAYVERVKALGITSTGWDADETVPIAWHLCRELIRGDLREDDINAWLENEYIERFMDRRMSKTEGLAIVRIAALEELCPDWYKP